MVSCRCSSDWLRLARLRNTLPTPLRISACPTAASIAVELLLTDVVLPGTSGRQLGDELALSRAGLKVVFMSGYTDDVILRHGIALGKVHFLKKPFSLADLALVVRRVLDE